MLPVQGTGVQCRVTKNSLAMRHVKRKKKKNTFTLGVLHFFIILFPITLIRYTDYCAVTYIFSPRIKMCVNEVFEFYGKNS